jgi:hypothetical protein
VSAVNNTVQPVPQKKEEAAMTAIGAAVFRLLIGLITDFGGPLAEDFLQTAKLSE